MITLYTKPNCPYCEMAKSWLKKNDINYSEIDVTIDELSLIFIKEQGHKTVPQIYFNGQILVEGGYTGLTREDPNLLKERIEKHYDN